MNWISGRRQQLTFLFLLGLTGLATAAAYQPLNPQWVSYRQAEKSYADHQFNEAARHYQRARELGVVHPGALARLGESYMASGQFIQARENFELHRTLRPQDQGIALNLARVYQYMNQPAEALSLYADLERRQGLDFALLVHRGDLQKQAQAYDAAEVDYRAALREHPDSAPLMMRLAEMLAWRKRHTEAEKVLRDVLRAHPDMSLARKHLARVLAWQGRNQEAMDQYRLALGEEP